MENNELLDGEQKGSGADAASSQTNKKVQQLWLDLQSRVNAQGVCLREVAQIKSKWKEIKSECEAYILLYQYFATPI